MPRRLIASLVLLTAALTTAGGWGGDAGADGAIMRALYGSGPPWLRAAAINVTALGSGTVLTLVTVAAASGMVLARAWRHAVFLVGVAIGGSLLVDGLKAYVGRPRPELLEHLVEVASKSWPSAHAANTAIIYLTLGALAGRLVPGVLLQRYVRFVAFVATGLIGVSRVYLGVHWPSDVAGGWFLGSGVALLAATLVRVLAPEEEAAA